MTATSQEQSPPAVRTRRGRCDSRIAWAERNCSRIAVQRLIPRRVSPSPASGTVADGPYRRQTSAAASAPRRRYCDRPEPCHCGYDNTRSNLSAAAPNAPPPNLCAPLARADDRRTPAARQSTGATIDHRSPGQPARACPRYRPCSRGGARIASRPRRRPTRFPGTHTYDTWPAASPRASSTT